MAGRPGLDGLAAICASLWLEAEVCPDKGSYRSWIQTIIEGCGDARPWV
jgi:hypothetical protein